MNRLVPAQNRPAPGPMRRAVRGVSLIELMLAITIGLMIMIGLTSVFVNSSNANREMRNNAEQIENGRYAIELMGQDIRHAGFYGELSKLPAAPGAIPDPCTAPTAGVVSDTVNNALALPVQPNSSSGCSALLTAANLQAGSDIIVVRRADTTMLPVTSTASATAAANTVYLQTTPDAAEIQIRGGSSGSIDGTMNATGAATTATMVRRDFGVAASGTPPLFPIIAAAIRKYRTHIYFVAPCSVPASGTTCSSSADQGRPIPTLKRLEMGANGTFSIVPLVEGIEAIRVEFGVDDSPSVADPGTGLIGDGMPDRYVHAPTSVADVSNTVSVRLYVLARNTSPTSGYKDDKTYTMGTYTTTATNDSYKRHVYGAETRIINQSGRREIPH